MGLIYPAGVLLTEIYAYHAVLSPLLFPMMAGSVLLGPAVASGDGRAAWFIYVGTLGAADPAATNGITRAVVR
ncbi:hypothetical protein [Novosphingobium sp.]|uniref:hypothetical protein n=1 Tax=Novosphingobium sp. TaxID=1874826 RepID=UPI002B4A7987|nr:hypothetical protein [Novosphingobium sp.]HKR93263.1 hypothetical protein [Novosphingobium sp.]